ncbi:MAG: hypothetical protein QOC81_3712 [Thermoanaerobaculia bacterium]|jgi:hypothetical protein|nr:hypothetical protein [Thermoanaerobaculia bacterium]
MASDLVELVRERPARPLAAQAMETIVEGSGNGFRLGFTGQTGNLSSEAFSFGVSDVEGHEYLRVACELHCNKGAEIDQIPA